MNEQGLRSEIARLNKIIKSLMDRAERNASVHGSDFSLLQTTIILENQVRKRTEELETALLETEKVSRALSKSEEDYRNIYDNAMVGIFQSTPTGRYLRVNPAMAAMLGFSSPGDVMRSVTNIGEQLYVNPEERTRYMEFLTEKDMVRDFEVQLYRKDRSKIWVSMNVRVVHDTDGSVSYYEGIFEDITERKRVEKALNESEAKYRYLFENAVEGIFQTTPDGRFISANPAQAELFGYDSPQEFMEQITDIGRQHYFNPQDREAFKGILETEGVIKGFEVQLVNKKGDPVWASISAHVVRSDDGEIVRYDGTLEDITKRKLAEQKLRDSEEALSSLINATDGTLLLIDAEGRVLVANKVAAERFGKSVQEITGVSQYDLFPPDVAALRKERYDEVVRTGKQTFFEDKRGDRFFESFGYPVFDEDGKVSKVAIFARDITERRAMEDSLRESEDKFRSLAEKSIVGIYLIQDDVFKYVNEKFAEMLGYTMGEMLDKIGPKDVIFPEDLPRVQDNIKRRISGEIESLNSEFRIVTKSKDVRNVEAYSSRAIYRGRPSVIGTLLDVTERKRAEENLRHLSVHDPLTGLHNRFLFEEELRRFGSGRFDPVSIVMCDLDGLKLVNDNLGHGKGDQQLVVAARILKKSFRSSDIVARIGGDEFAVLLPDCSVGMLNAIRYRLKRAMQDKFIPGTDIPLMMSVGHATGNTKERPIGELLKEADASMYDEKNHNRQAFRRHFESIINRT